MKKFTAIFFSLCLLLSCSVPCFAAEIPGGQSLGEITLSTQVPATHPLTVSAEHATVSYKGAAGASFEVPRLTEFALKISVEDGYRINQILLDGTDVTTSYGDGTLTLDGIYEEAKLTIITETAPIPPGGGSDQPGDTPQTGGSTQTGGTQKTGDTGNISLWIALLLLSAGGAAATALCGRKKDDLV